MKALTLTQPFASLVAIGAKSIETRDWGVHYRGALAIHAAKGWTTQDRAVCWREPFLSVVAAWKDTLPDAEKLTIISALPRGAIIAVTDLKDCFRFRPGLALVGHLPPHELAFGNFASGRYGFELTHLRALPEPVPTRGMLGLWNVPADAEEEIDAQLARVTA